MLQSGQFIGWISSFLSDGVLKSGDQRAFCNDWGFRPLWPWLHMRPPTLFQRPTGPPTVCSPDFLACLHYSKPRAFIANLPFLSRLALLRRGSLRASVAFPRVSSGALS